MPPAAVPNPATRSRSLSVRLHPGSTLLVLAVLLSFGVMGINVILLSSQRHKAIADNARALQNLSLVLAEQADRAFRAVELAQSSLIEEMRRAGERNEQDFLLRMSAPGAADLLRQAIAGLPQLHTLMLIDHAGRLVNTSGPSPAPSASVANTDYFQAFAADQHLQSLVSQPVPGDGPGGWTFSVARRVSAPDGRFLGLVVGAVRLAYFEEFYKRLALAPGSSISLFRRDGVLLARYPHADPQIGRSFAQSDNFRRLLASLDQGTVRQTSMIDGTDRLMSAHALPHSPVVIVASEEMATVLSVWHHEAVFLWSTAVVKVLFIFGLVFLVRRQLTAQEQVSRARAAQREAELARNVAEVELHLAEERADKARVLRAQFTRFDAALNNMLQGLAMFDRDNRLLVRNRRCEELLGLAPESGAGTHFEDIFAPAVAAGRLVEYDVQALAEWIADRTSARAPEAFIWQLTAGPVLSVAFQPMEDAGWLVTFEDVTERRQAEAKVAYLAQHDALTGLPNRVLLHQKLAELSGRVERGELCAVLCIDLDRFKRVNDTLGHPTGDTLLKAATGRLRACVRDTDMIARLGGDEFVVLQAGIERPSDATRLAVRLIEALSEPFQLDGHQVVVGASIGIAFAPVDGSDGNQLLKNADMALYRAKLDGRGVFRLFQAEMDAEMQARRLLELDLRAALRTGQFELFFQPLVGIQSRAVSGFEALLRWSHPTRGLVLPSEFIPLAEEIGLIVPIGEWVLRRACHVAAGWPAHLKVAVNISPVQFRSPGLITAVAMALRSSGLDPARLELEITEAVLLHDTAGTLETLHAMRELGVEIVMDDFGTGYSSLSYLRQFPFSKIKIDRTFVRDVDKRNDCAAIVRAVAALGNDLGMTTTAEGVETREQLAALAAAACTSVQGFMFSPPLPADQLVWDIEVPEHAGQGDPPALVIAAD